jgi:hypothetical protein
MMWLSSSDIWKSLLGCTTCRTLVHGYFGTLF